MDLLMIISNPNAGPIADGLARAAVRKGLNWGAFFTNDGVKILEDRSIAGVFTDAAQAIACEDSWTHHMGDKTCPIELGSQTNNSLAVSEAGRIISL